MIYIKGRIINKIQGFYYVKSGEETYECKLRGILKRKDKKDNCVVGDFVDISEDGHIIKVYERKNIINRPLVSNIDFLVIQFAAKDPVLELDRLNLLLLNSFYYRVSPILVINKIDLLSQEEKEELNKKIQYLKDIKIPIFLISTYENTGIKELEEMIKDKTVAFGGPSGVGKSSLINFLQESKELVVGETSKRLKAGKHTTRDSNLLPSTFGGYVIDTPGFSSIEIPPIKDFNELILLFSEFHLEEGKSCKFLDCRHINEPDCMIKEMVKEGKISEIRYNFYKKIYEKLKDERWKNYEKY